MRNIQFDEVYAFHKAVLTKADLDEETCEAVSFGLCETSMRGVDSHGIRLFPHYARSALLGRKIHDQITISIRFTPHLAIWMRTTHLVTLLG